MTATQKRVLVIEDDPLVAMVMEDVLLRMGLAVYVNHSLADATNELELAEFDVALVDMGLRGESAYPLVQILTARGTPFAIVTGADQPDLVTEFPGVLIATKPLGIKALETVVQTLLGQAETTTR
ncbi:MAG TPA: response regulator [Rhodanobacter sp.]|jgi:DNA-binding response OmpR family regulator|nr:response regulator [Rhodanobacter sp.]